MAKSAENEHLQDSAHLAMYRSTALEDICLSANTAIWSNLVCGICHQHWTPYR